MNGHICTVSGCNARVHARGLCQSHYSRRQRGASLETPYQRRILNDHETRFDSQVEMDPNGGCWLWSGATSEFGHGRFSVKYQPIPAHRFAFERANGPVPPGLNICHHCDVPQCVNPAHLFAGTQADNVADMMRKGRYVRGRWPKGSECRHAKLTEGEVKEILTALSAGRTQRDIAGRYGISQTMVGYIGRGVSWRHVSRLAA